MPKIYKFEKLKLFLVFIMLFIMNQNLFSQSDETANYINSVFYYKRLSLLRTSYEVKEQENSGLSCLIMDFNFYARDPDNDLILPMMVGVGTTNTTIMNRLGLYFLAYSSNLFNFEPVDTTDKIATLLHWGGTADEAKKKLRYVGITAGLNLDLKYVTLQGDITLSKNTFTYYTKGFIPSINTQFGFGFSKFKEMGYDSISGTGNPFHIEQIELGDKLGWDMIDVKTYALKYVTLGMRYINITKVKYIPNLSFTLRQLYPELNSPFDIEVFFETRSEKPQELAKLKDYEVRSAFYFFTEKMGGIGAWYTGFSFKSPEDGYSRTISESGKVYNGQSGFGFELGLCMRYMDGKGAKIKFLDNNFLKYCIYYNYSEYFERYPGNIWGMKFRLLI